MTLKDYADKLAEFYGIEKSSSTEYHTIGFPDGSTKILEENDLNDIFGLRYNRKFSFENLGLKTDLCSSQSTFIVSKKTKATSSSNYKKSASTNTCPLDYKEAA